MKSQMGISPTITAIISSALRHRPPSDSLNSYFHTNIFYTNEEILHITSE